MLYAIREKFSKLSVKIGIVFSKLKLSPNQWTLLTLIPTIIALYFLVQESFLLAALLFAIAAFFDLIDGSVARVTGNVTKLGAYLDTIMDRYVEGIIIVGLLFIALPTLLLPAYVWLFIYFFGSMMTTYVKAAAKEKELVEKELKGGLLERAERLTLLFIGLIIAYFSRVYFVYIIVLLALLSNISALQRIYYAVKSRDK
ncbi:MAG: CDP-alcohol phosphatidyltransferase family protein [Candidatus Aenigmarchaeota archaeon]|nr:CDP-alcohol phosphatidyltransferase family protein [Candidatus Aenigmarchaeota archaeon]